MSLTILLRWRRYVWTYTQAVRYPLEKVPRRLNTNKTIQQLTWIYGLDFQKMRSIWPHFLTLYTLCFTHVFTLWWIQEILYYKGFLLFLICHNGECILLLYLFPYFTILSVLLYLYFSSYEFFSRRSWRRSHWEPYSTMKKQDSYRKMRVFILHMSNICYN